MCYTIKKCMWFGTDMNCLQESVSALMDGNRPAAFANKDSAEKARIKAYRETMHANGFPCSVKEVQDALSGKSILVWSNADHATARLASDGDLVIISAYGFYKRIRYEIV